MPLPYSHHHDNFIQTSALRHIHVRLHEKFTIGLLKKQ